MILISQRGITMISDGKKLLKLLLYKMTNLIFTDFMKKYKLKKDSMNESDFKKIYNYPLYPTDSKI